MAKHTYEKWKVVLVNLDPTIGAEIKKIRPCLIISPNSANRHLHTVLIAPLTSTIRNIPTRLRATFQGVEGEICFDQIKAIDKVRIIKVIGHIDPSLRRDITELLKIMFDEPDF